MKTLSLLLLGLLVAGQISAQNMSIARDQAKRTTGAGGGATPSAAPPSGAAQPAPMDPVLAATLDSITKLQTSFNALAKAADTNAVAEQRTPLLNTLSAATKGKKASAANVKKLAGDLMEGLAGKKLSANDSQKFARCVHALFNAAHLNTSQQEHLLADANKLLTTAGVSAESVTAISADLKAIADETK